VDILGIGPMELLLILIVALMVFGPDRLPTIGSKLGRAMRDMRRATRAISEEINATRAAIESPAKELAEPFQEVAGAAKTMSGVAAAARNPGEAIRQSVLKELNAPADAGQTPAPPAEREKTIAPPDLTQETASETGATPLPAGGDLEPPVAPSGATGLPAGLILQPEPDPLAASGAGPNAVKTGDAPEVEPQQVLQPGEEETLPHSTNDSPPIMEP